MMISMLNGYLFNGLLFPWMQGFGILTLLLESNVSPYRARCCTKFVKVQRKRKYYLLSTRIRSHISSPCVMVIPFCKLYIINNLSKTLSLCNNLGKPII